MEVRSDERPHYNPMELRGKYLQARDYTNGPLHSPRLEEVTDTDRLTR